MYSPLSPSQKLVCCLLTISQMLLQVSSFAIHHCQCSSNSNNSNSNSSNNNKNHFNININNINNNNNIRNTQFQLYGRKKKGNLAKNVTPGGISTKTKGTKKNKKQQQQVAQVSSSLSQWVATQDFEKDDEMENPPLESTTATTTSSSSSSSSSTKSKSNNNNKSQQLDYSTTTKYNTRIQSTIASIQEIISSNNFDVSKLLQYISQLVMIQKDINQDIGENNNNNNNNNNILKQLTNNQKKNNQKSKSSSSSSSNDYTLAWVGSDDAICHVGTGLHKVPLARLQDLFMTLGGGTDTNTNTNTTPSSNLKIPQGLLKGSKKNRNSGTATMITVMEVIRILGPFPNVRNTLQGRIMNASLFKPSGGSGSNASKSTSSTAFGHSSSDNKNRKQLPISTTTNTATATRSSKVGENVVITYDSMTDGLGKEITAGNEGDTRSLGLNILFADENAVVAVVPTNNDGGDDDAGDDDDELALFGTNGKNVLLFLKEEELDDKLEGLRAA